MAAKSANPNDPNYDPLYDPLTDPETAGTTPPNPVNMAPNTGAQRGPSGNGYVAPGTPDIPASGSGHFDVNPATGQPWTMNLGKPIAPTSDSQGGTNTGSIPSYVSQSGPAGEAVWGAFASKGITPRDASDFQYWVDHINATGGPTQANMAYWTQRMAQSQGGVGDYLERPEAGTNTGTIPGTINGGAAGTGVDSTGLSSAYRDAILSQLAQFSTPTDINSPTLKPQVDAARVANQRGLDRTRSAMAERAFASGDGSGSALHSGAFDLAQRQALENAGTSEAQTESGLVNSGEQQRLSMLQSLLGAGANYLNADQQRAIQQQIAQGQLGLGYANLSQQGQLANNQLGFNYAQLGQQGQIAGGQLGLQYNQLQAYLNQQAILQALGG